jgi:penicillin V acylase-like amidase (Ntn superfamily)
MNRLKSGFIYLCSISAFFQSDAPSALGCSRIFWNTNSQAKVVGRTMDLYMSDQPKLVIFPRGVSRQGQAGENSLSWKSKYGSVATTALNSATSDGMNEKGLAVHLLYLHGAEYEQRDKRPGVSNALWGQYFLDNCSSVAEALSRLNDFQIVSVEVTGRQWPVHLAIEDSSGDSAILEYSKGKLVVHHGPQYSVMTNEPLYSDQLENLKKYKLFGGGLRLPGDTDPMSRFVRATSFLKTLPEPKNYVEAVAGVLSVTRTVMTPFGAEDTSGGDLEDAWPTQ